MKRRVFLGSALALFLGAPALAGGETVDYEPGVIADLLAEGKTVFVDYAASWCNTCKAQERAITALRTANPAYDQALTFVRVDWDDFGSHAVATSRNIPRRSTLLVLKGDAELGRIVAGTRKSDIQALMDTGLNAAS